MEIRRIDLGMVNAYILMTGGNAVLIDTGMPFHRQKVEAAIGAAGIKPGTLKLIILTHGDIDHSGNGRYLRDKYGAPVAMHKNDAGMVGSGNFMTKRKVKSLVMRLMHLFMGRSRRFKEILSSFERFTPDIFLEDGLSLAEYGTDAKVAHIPGHTPGSIAVFTPDRDLFCGDTMNNRGKRPSGASIVENEADLKISMGKIDALGAKQVYPGHGRPFKMSEFIR